MTYREVIEYQVFILSSPKLDLLSLDKQIALLRRKQQQIQLGDP